MRLALIDQKCHLSHLQQKAFVFALCCTFSYEPESSLHDIVCITILKAENDKFPHLMPHAQSKRFPYLRFPQFIEIGAEEAKVKPTNEQLLLMKNNVFTYIGPG